MTLMTFAKSLAVFSAAGVITLVAMFSGATKVRADDQDEGNNNYNLASIGLKIAPSFINARGKDPNLVGLGSFIVNGQADCNGCHGSDPITEFAPNHNPYLLPPGQTVQYTQAVYLNGGADFGPVGGGIVNGVAGPGPDIITRNLTPDKTGNPAGGINLKDFITIIRTGHDFDHLHLNCSATVTDNCYFPPTNGAVLQVMPWPVFQNMTDYQLTAIWTYLSTVPCNPHNDALGAQYPWLKNVCQ